MYSNHKQITSKVVAHPVINKLSTFPADSYSIFASNALSRDIFFKREIAELNLVIIGNNPTITEELTLAFPEIREDSDCIYFLYYENEIFVKISYYQVSGKLNLRNKSYKQLVSSICLNAGIATRCLLYQIKTNELTLLDPLAAKKILLEKDISKYLISLDSVKSNPLCLLRYIYDSYYLNYDLTDEFKTLIPELAEGINIIRRFELGHYLLSALRFPLPSQILETLFRLNILKSAYPEIDALAGVEQMNEYNHKDVFFHTCKVIDNICGETDNVWLRLSALLHDIAKPATKRFIEGTGWTFHAHEVIGSRFVKRIFTKYYLPREYLSYIQILVKLHLRPSALAQEEVTDSAVRRLITESQGFIEDLLTLCRADITSKNPAKVSKVLSKYLFVEKRILEVKEKDTLAMFQSPVRGDEIMRLCNIKPSKEVGLIKDDIESAILNGDIENTYEAALEYLQIIKGKYLTH